MEIVPQSHQIEWFNLLIKRFKKELILMDTSSMGCGKTFVPLFICQTLEVRMLVIGPPGIEANWRTLATRYGVDMVEYVSYQRLAGTTTRGTNNEWLEREDTRAADKSNGTRGALKITFTATDALVKLVRKGVLIVFDEVQKVSAGNSYTKAMQCITNTLLQYPKRSRCILLSATPFKDEKQIFRFFALLGICECEKDVIGKPKADGVDLSFRERMSGYPLGQIYERCMKYDPEGADAIIDHIRGRKENAKTAKEMAVELYTQILSKHIAGSMQSLESSTEYRCTYTNLYCPLGVNTCESLSNNIDIFQNEIGFNSEYGIIVDPRAAFGKSINALQAIHETLAEALYVQIVDQLETKENSKAVMFTYYKCTTEVLSVLFADYNPLFITADTKKLERQRIADLFRSESDYRVMICNGVVASEGLSMHSETPGMEIYGYGLPYWDITLIFQQSGRIFRAGKDGIVNDAYFHIVYPPYSLAMRLRKIIDALTNASKTMAKAISGIKKEALPGNYINKILA